MIIDAKIHQFLKDKYGTTIILPRYGIEVDDGDNTVEVYFKQINILPIPNKTLFKLWKDEPRGFNCYISKCATVIELEKKI